MFKKKAQIIFLVLPLFIIGSGFLIWHWVRVPPQSSVRLMYALRLKALRVAIDSYRDSHDRIPNDLKELEFAGVISGGSYSEDFRYVGGDGGVLAFQRESFRRVKNGERWGGRGEIAKYEIPAARLVLFADRSIRFVDESDFQRKYGWLLVEPKGE